MDLLLVFLSLLLVLLGIIGSFIPVLPGPPVSWLGLLVLHFTKGVPMDYTFLGITLFVAILIFILDYIIPSIGTKRFGGSRAGAIGTMIGLFVGIFSPIPFGILIGPFVGALIGELIFNQSDSKTAFKAAVGSFLGFVASTFMKFIVTVIFLVLFIYKLFAYSDTLFVWS
ncbi:membrane protein [Dokdonia pacifica]|uniref:DUF456 domain-containing protein n=1 Tax=Dokdonia pacifica TaxID=1627892 RepID=A0A238ZX61_9FLAO|nr:DUF456 domain-containing protein [Dokdonia pacifica]GGG33815.1 membrane protein [Dokdonia pacifica]SNR87955.1 hypothetical protein SAMN06265376_1043 [Dokdonia pacifica]